MTLDYIPGKAKMNLYAGDGGSMLIRVWEDPEKTIPFDMNGWEFLAQVRTKDVDPVVLMTFACTLGDENNELILSWTGEQSAALVTGEAGGRYAKKNCVGDVQGNPTGGEPLTLVRFEPLICWNEVSRTE